ncbi:MAG: polysaccharide pyruvyl transferase family protein [Candidatus Competibacteraceae bacterium]|nr:MAG: polysaccharide pyruvyl transferase family protein [Candidatus Competibacteraceae bacterium]
MKKIGIITYHFVTNYGAALQAWALQKFLQSLGHEVFIIDYRPSYLTSGGYFWWPVDAWHCHANLVIAYLKLMTLRQALLGDGGKTTNFAIFHERFLKTKKPIYHSLNELKRKPPEADIFICGSDQIWNASVQFGIDPAYFLDFVPSGIKKISYATSFGRSFIEERFKQETARLIARLDAIAIREQSGVEIVKNLTGKKAIWVPDPTLLVEDGYPEVERPLAVPSDYLFSYTLRSRELVAKVEKRVGQSQKLKIVSPEILKLTKIGAPGPLEWLGYIKAAKFVVTNSYHGTIFSIIFRKPFIFVGLSGHKADFNERALSLLDRLKLSAHVISDFNEEKIDAISKVIPDWDYIYSEVATWRKIARSFLELEVN